jgi:hypothetical protein
MPETAKPTSFTPGVQADPLRLAMLRTLTVTQACAGSWPQVLRRRLFTAARPDKAEITRRNHLGSHAGLLYLQILWKETGPVTEAELERFGAERLFEPDEGVTCHGMAIESAVDKKETDRLDKRIRSIMRAARHYGLVEEKRVGAKRKALSATPRLHELLKEHHEAVEAIAERIPPECFR